MMEDEQFVMLTSMIWKKSLFRGIINHVIDLSRDAVSC